MAFEYKVVPAPTKGLKARGKRSTVERFANALETVMNDLGAEGWEYQRTDTLPCEERDGIMSKSTSYQNMLVFRRSLTVADTSEEEAVAEPKALPAPVVPVVHEPVEEEPVAEIEDVIEVEREDSELTIPPYRHRPISS